MKELDDFTVERLEKIANLRPFKVYNGRSYYPAVMSELSSAEIVSLARIALAAKTAEPEAFRVGGRLFSSMYAAGCYSSEMKLKIEPLYLDAMPNSPELPDGWIPCAERMPEKRGHYLVCTESGLVARSSYSPEHTDYDDVRGCHKLARKDFGKYSRHFEYARASVSKITHWMALPPPPTTEK
jgi:hypothetical protein